MHTDGTSTSPNPVNPYYAAAEKATEARQPFQVRKKPVKRAASGQFLGRSELACAVGQWMNGGQAGVDRKPLSRSASGKAANAA
jgi:hypothetical protein